MQNCKHKTKMNEKKWRMLMSKALQWSSYFRSSNPNHFTPPLSESGVTWSVQKQELMRQGFETDVLKTLVFSF